jgi:hypothetical protein
MYESIFSSHPQMTARGKAGLRHEVTDVGAGFVAGWGLTHIALWAVLGAVLFGFELLPNTLSGILLGGTLGSLVLGLVQWPHVQPHLRSARWWPLASALGGFGGVLLGAGVGTLLQSFDALASAAAVITATVTLGVAQWVVLRQQVKRAGWWIVASGLGWGPGLLAGFLVVVLGFVLAPTPGLPGGLFVGGAVGGALAGAVGGTVSGGVLMWLLRRQSS